MTRVIYQCSPYQYIQCYREQNNVTMLFSITCSIVFVFVVIYYLFIKPKHEFWKKRGVVGPTPRMIVGNLGESITMKKSLGQLFTEIYK